MPTEQIIITCENTNNPNGQICTIPLDNFFNGNVATFQTPFFSAGDMFIALELLTIIILGIVVLSIKGAFSVSIFKKYQGVNQKEGKEEYKI